MRARLARLLVATLLVAGCVPDAPDPQAGQELSGRAFDIVGASQHGAERALAEGPLVVSFRRPPSVIEPDRPADVLVGWDGGCNAHSLLVEVTPTRLAAHDDGAGPDQTLVDCPELRAQERWLSAVFTSGPRWTWQGDQLVLTAGVSRLVLEEHDDA